MSNFLYPKVKELQSEYEDAKYNSLEEAKCNLYDDDDDDGYFAEADYHHKYHIEFNAFEDLKVEFYLHFRTELLEYGNSIMLCIFTKAIDNALDNFFIPEVYLINNPPQEGLTY